jgi:hypothetical protein
VTNSQYGFTLQSQPGLRFEILAATNLALPVSNWTSLGPLTNLAGATPYLDPATNLDRRFYQCPPVALGAASGDSAAIYVTPAKLPFL